MQRAIENILNKTPGLKGKEIAKKLNRNRKSVNSLLHKNKDIFMQDSNYCWALVQHVLELEPDWVTDYSFEKSLLKAGCLLDNKINSVLVKIPPRCKIMMIAAARLLALLNQLVAQKKNVCIDLTDCGDTKSFLSREGFFDHLDEKVTVLPKRPDVSGAQIYQGNSENLVEFGAIDLQRQNKKLVDQLWRRFVRHSDSRYQTAAFTVFSELIGNVREHSESPIKGFAALQKYGGSKPHIQTVVSDSGLGIAKTLRPSLKTHYPIIYRQFKEESTESDAGLVKLVLSEGEISRFGSGHGLGFKSSCQQAMKFDAELLVRQDRYYLKFIYEGGKLVDIESRLNLPQILGSHFCFDFFIDHR